MYKILFLSFFLPALFSFTPVREAAAPCSCPSVANLQKTGQTGSSITYAWSGSGIQYKVYYVRREDEYVSGYFYTSNTSYAFTGLSAGHYTFYFQTLCEGEFSNFIGIEDVIGV